MFVDKCEHVDIMTLATTARRLRHKDKTDLFLMSSC